MWWTLAVLALLLLTPGGAAAKSYVYSQQRFDSRFGDALRADLFFPAKDGRRRPGRFPVILQYDYGPVVQRDATEAADRESLDGAPLEYVKHGYVFAVVGQSGTGGSEGPQSIYDTRVDLSGVDAVEWMGTRRWSTGAVGMSGQSGPGIAQPLVAQFHPRHLRTIVPVVTTTDWYRDVLCRGGMPTSWERVLLFAIVLGEYNGTNGIEVPTTPEQIEAFAALWTRKLINGWIPPSSEIVQPSDPDSVAGLAALATGCGEGVQRISRVARTGRIRVPVWSFGSWNDFFLLGNVDLYTSTRHARARRLTIDNVGHSSPAHGYDFVKQTLRWYDRWLKGERNGVAREKPVEYYSIEDNHWHTANDWPLRRARRTRLYLNAGSPDPLAKGSLTRGRPGTPGESDSYLYDYVAGRNAGTFGILSAHADGGSDNALVRNQPNGPGDQRLDAADSLAYLGAPLKHPVEVTGPITASLFASSTSDDTDWVVKLVDVFPGEGADPTTGPQPGYWGLTTTGWLSGQRRVDSRSPKPIPVGKTVRYTVHLLPTSYRFKAGHRIGVMIASADLMRAFPNSHPAVNTIFRTPRAASSVSLPIVPARSSGAPRSPPGRDLSPRAAQPPWASGRRGA